MRVVLDTNVLLSAFGTHGLCQALFEVCLQHHTIVLSEFILNEFGRGYSGKFRASEEVVEGAVGLLRRVCELVIPAEIPEGMCNDPDDLAVLGTAVAARVDVLVTGDSELLRLGSVEGIPIETPRAFYDRVR